ncbi:insecticidal delta-endotoxin Cry8Ea1 family protein [Bacillus albus]|uniref:insecticidal delta-endotoxin Cry8Ea1 family protein n=1 Tax=Bacillus albus TaxID=2026189 RepID=UPI00101EA62B|nr:insecticidal delta-endotoxin Cry8Ea1 family protein [Bacillus albus]
MNRNKDCNDGIPKAISDMYDRYPYANDPNAALQNMDYKEWLMMNQGEELNGLDPRLDIDRDGVAMGMNVVGTLMWAFASPIVAEGGAIICAMATILPLFWPDKEEPKKDIWEEFIKHGDKFFDKKITKLEKDRAKTFIAGMETELEKYKSALEKWQDERNQANAAAVQEDFNDAGDYLDTKMQELKLEKYEQTLLSCYAQAAFMHLNLLQQGVVFADEWRKDNPGGKTSEYWYDILKKRIPTYINYCMETYIRGLYTLKEAYKTKWNTYNTYRRDMTIMVLDLIALFPNFDTKKYPKGVRTELTREIYTDALTNAYMDGATHIGECEVELTRKPHIFSWLKGWRFATEKTDINNLSGIKNRYLLTGNSTLEEDKSWYGKGPDENSMAGSFAITNCKVKRCITANLKIRRHAERFGPGDLKPNAINRIESTMVNDEVSKLMKIYSAGKDFPGAHNITFIEPIVRECSETTAQPCKKMGDKYSHILSYALAFRKQIPEIAHYGMYMYSFAWTHHSVDRHNTIAEDTITQIPAVKASGENPDFSVVKGPGHTGGDLVELSGKSEKGLVIKCSVPKAKNYRIRLRYAANKDTRVTVQVSGGNSHGLILAKKTYDDNNYKGFSSFNHLDTNATVSCLNKRAVVTIKNDLADTSILIDKIEFIPLED